MGSLRRLALSRERAAIVVGDRLHFVATSGRHEPTRIDLPGIVDLCTVGSEEFWAAAGEPLALHRLRCRDGSAIAAPIVIGGAPGILRPVAIGVPAAMWSATRDVIVSGGSIAELPSDADCTIPVSATRWVVCRRDRIALYEPTAQRWSVAHALVGGRAIDGAVLFDGRAVAIVVARDQLLIQLVIANLHDGTIMHRITLTGITQVRFAPARGHALLVSGSHLLLVIDLRFGQLIKQHVESREIVEAAIDSSAQSFILRHGDGSDDLSFGAIRDLDAHPRTSIEVSPPAVEPIALPDRTSPAAPTVEPVPAPVLDFHRDHPPLAMAQGLSPRPTVRLVDRDVARALLDRYQALIASMLGRAIAIGWDHGRIAFPNDGALPYEHEVRGILKRATGRASGEITDAEAKVLQATTDLRAAEATLVDGVSPLGALAEEFGLSPLARLLLLLVAGPTLWGELARLYGILGNDDHRPLVDELLLIQILAGQVDRHEISRELDRDSPLVRHGFLRVGTGKSRPFLDLSCEPIIQRVLQSADHEAELGEIQIARSTRTFDELLIASATKVTIVEAVSTSAGASRWLLRGRTGAGRHTLLAALAATANRQLGVIDATPIARDVQGRIHQLRAALYRAHLLGLLPCIDGLEFLASDDQGGRELVAQLIDELPGPLAICLPWGAESILRPGYTAIDLPSLSMTQRTTCWRIIAAEHGLSVRQPDELADRYGVGPGVMHRVCERVARVASSGDRGAELELAVRQHLDTSIRATATRVERLASWSRVVLPADVQEAVLELIARIKHRRIVYDSWGFDQILTTARGVTALFQGAPGTGKTLVASAIANELGMDLYRVDLSRVMSKWIGETEQNLAKLFDAAEDGHAIILFDEADSLFAKRTEVKTSVDRYANLEVNYLLQRFDTFEGIAILTTNFGTSIDNAFKRRLSFRLTFPFPDEDSREALWRSHLPPSVPTDGAFDFAELARRYQMSGGYIRNAVLRAAFLAAEEHVPLTQEHCERAIKAEFREFGRIAEGGMLQ